MFLVILHLKIQIRSPPATSFFRMGRMEGGESFHGPMASLLEIQDFGLAMVLRYSNHQGGVFFIFPIERRFYLQGVQ